MLEYVVILMVLVVVGFWVLHPLLRSKRIESLSPQKIDAAIEREVRQLRGKKKPKGERGNAKETGWQINFCPQCGKKVIPNSNFCQDCGMQLIFPGRKD